MHRTTTFLALAALLSAVACETIEDTGRDDTTACQTVTAEANVAAK